MRARLARTGSGSGLVVGEAQDRFVRFAEVRRVARDSGSVEAQLLAHLLEECGDQSYSWVPLLDRWAEVGETMLDIARGLQAGATDLADEVLLPPVVRHHARIFAAGGNFADHLSAATKALTGEDVPEETFVADKVERGLPPWGFFVLPETVLGSDAEVVPPPSAVALDYEGEVAAVVSRGGRFLAPDDVAFYGASCWSDFSIRDPGLGLSDRLDRGYFNWTFQKTFHSGSTMGPWLTVDVDFAPDDLDIRLLVNDVQRQQSTTASMIYSFAEVAAYVSEYVELLPGDIIASGTPAGTAVEQGRAGAFLEHGDRVTVVSDALGTLRNTVVRRPAAALGRA